MPNSVGPLPHPSRLPVKVVLVPATPARLQAGVLQANKRKLLLAVKRGDAAKVSELLRDGTSANTVDANGVPVVAWATFAGDPEIIRVLLDAGARVKINTSSCWLCLPAR